MGDTEEGDALLRSLARKYAVLRFGWRTPLGEEVVQAFRTELDRGARIRWPLRLDAITSATLAQCPRR